VLWSISGVMLKLFHVAPLAFAFYRSLAAGLAMFAAVPILGGRFPPWRWMALSIAVHTPMVALFILSMAKGTAASGILLQYTAPLWVALLGWFFQRRHVGRRTITAMVVAGAGLTVMICTGHVGGWLAPTYGVASGMAYASLILVLEKIDRKCGGQVNPAWVVLINNLGSAALLLPFVAYAGDLHVPRFALAAVAATGLVQMAMPYVLFQFALRRVTPVDASLLTLLEPVLNPLWVAIMTSEVPERGTVAGGIAILVAMVIEATKPGDGD
jgi:drug/metabolite transporter (DMT)-like permease